MTTNLLKKYMDIVNESLDDSMDAPRLDRREGNRQTLRDQIFGYLEDAQAAIDSGDYNTAKEYIGYVIELVDDNV